MSVKKNLTLAQLSETQLHTLAQHAPRWVFDTKPYFMMHHRPDWVARYEPNWLCDKQPRYMIQHHVDWVAFKRPDILYSFDLELLLTKNPRWAVNHLPEILAYHRPDLLQEYDQALYEQHRATTTHAQRPLWKRIWDYLNLRKPIPNPKVPKQYLALLLETCKSELNQPLALEAKPIQQIPIRKTREPRVHEEVAA